MMLAHYITVGADEDIFSARRRWRANAPVGYRGNMFFRLATPDQQSEFPALGARLADAAIEPSPNEALPFFDHCKEQDVAVRWYIGPDPFDMTNPRMQQAMGAVA